MSQKQRLSNKNCYRFRISLGNTIIESLKSKRSFNSKNKIGLINYNRLATN